MRVIAGSSRHLTLKTLEGLDIRPTTDKIKETLFNILQFKLSNKNFLDLFAGSGAIGIEALSRGCKNATFVDSSSEACKIIKENLEHTKLIDKSQIFKKNALSFIENDAAYMKEKFDFIFLDPPYEKDLYVPVLESILKNKIYNDDCLFILETNIKDDVSKIENMGYKIDRIKEYKTNKHVFFKKD